VEGSSQAESTKGNNIDLIPIRATIISAIFVVPYLVIIKVFIGELNSNRNYNALSLNLQFEIYGSENIKPPNTVN
jgi:hypothetical protein